MNSSKVLQKRIDELDTTKPNLTKIREIANEYGKNQETARHLWKHGGTYSRLFSLLIMDLKAIDTGYIETMIQDIEAADKQDQRKLSDWLIANVLMKKASLKKEAGNWRSAKSIIKPRIFWSIQARTVKAENRELNVQLLEALEQKMASANEMVQEPMNWCAAQIGIEVESLRVRCLKLGEKLGLYKDYPVSKGCTSPYLPIWITTIVEKQGQ